MGPRTCLHVLEGRNIVVPGWIGTSYRLTHSLANSRTTECKITMWRPCYILSDGCRWETVVNRQVAFDVVVDREDKNRFYVTYCLYVGRYLQGDDEDLWGYVGQTERDTNCA